jgi:chemotaxis protein methyltransferase CheR
MSFDVTTDADFIKLVSLVSGIVEKSTGVILGEKQFSMVSSRLQSRILKLALQEPRDYLAYLKSNLQSETEALVGLLTTHHTYFFRESVHFDYLVKSFLPNWIQTAKSSSQKTLKILSAACSRGHEVYSLAMLLDYHICKKHPDLDYEIIGTDVDSESIEIAKNAVYTYKEVSQSPGIYLNESCSRGSGEIQNYVKIKKHIREKCQFFTFNLVTENISKFNNKKFDLVFCRNVFIYFKPHDVEAITEKLGQLLVPKGLFFIGIAESLSGLKTNFSSLGPSVFVDKKYSEIAPESTAKKEAAADKPRLVSKIESPEIVKPIRVLCVDDSPSILALLKKILSQNEGFEVAATASNGREAIDLIKRDKFDIITLDIHMPVMDGIEFLKQTQSQNRPPVIMLSSVNRENADLAISSLQLGAVDYIEKPSLSNLTESADEIKTKIKTCLLLNSVAVVSDLDKNFKRKFVIENPSSKSRWAFLTVRDSKKIIHLAKQQKDNDPPMVFVLDANATVGNVLIEKICADEKLVIEKGSDKLQAGKIYFYLLDSAKSVFEKQAVNSVCVFLSFGNSKKLESVLNTHSKLYVVLDDLGPNSKNIFKQWQNLALYSLPITSFYSISEEILSEKAGVKSAS